MFPVIEKKRIPGMILLCVHAFYAVYIYLYTCMKLKDLNSLYDYLRLYLFLQIII